MKKVIRIIIVVVLILIMGIIVPYMADSYEEFILEEEISTEHTTELTIVTTIKELITETSTVKQTTAVQTTKTATTVTTTESTTVTATEPTTEDPAIEHVTETEKWQGEVLNTSNGTVEGPSGRETYYNLDMSGVISIMRSEGYQYEYWERADGVKMFGSYVMCAANFQIRPRGSIVDTSLGKGIVCDTGGFASANPTQLDIATNW